ncbi:MAG TPA: glycoside hydrolase family 25 protein [Candidatus Faecousia excrementigallinarum]|uniref:Glycoside hydrolase family 25 protein n=1 Tax=Candidatus Faecousia excrementigallinarum TaxID=2840806 RepID=A0A9D0Z1U5_9FIRM|nr:glycoside hydrolase family 25 protein [Candidatus Faecousia excrementigallinarum]
MKQKTKLYIELGLGLLVGLTALVLLAVVLVQNALKESQREAAQPTTEAAAVLPTNPYGPEDFRVEENGYITCLTGEARQGIDVSEWQGDIDWQQVKDGGIEFAIIRLGYRRSETGELSTDEKALANLQGAAEAGIPTGAYFFSQAVTTQEALEEAEYALSLLEGYTLTYPLIYDWEYLGEDARTADVDARTLTDCIKTFCGRVEEAGFQSMIYFNPHFHENEVLYLEELTDYHFWLAMYDTQMDYPYQIDMWQYSCTGSVPGITGDVDLNLYLPRKQ